MTGSAAGSPRRRSTPCDEQLPLTASQPQPFHVLDAERDALGERPGRGEEEQTRGEDGGGLERQSKTSQRSDDSFSAYLEHPVRESTPARMGDCDAQGEQESGLTKDVQGESRADSSQGSSSLDVLEEQDASWPSMVEGERERYDDGRDWNRGPIIIPDLQDQEEDDGEMEVGGEKKRRRRTNKAEANVLASVFAQTQFPDAHTREALAQRLNMKAKAVSIWFQNRRQAMKKRASRFGGVEGVNGPAVMAASMHVMDMDRSTEEQTESHPHEKEQRKRWASLEDVASLSRKRSDTLPEVRFPMQSEPVSRQLQPLGHPGEHNLSSAPILDFICRRQGEKQLSRMASMPSLASVMSAKVEKTKTACLKKDLRELLPSVRPPHVPELHRSRSASSLFVGRENDQPRRERCVTLQMNDDGRATLQSPRKEKTRVEEHRDGKPGPRMGLPAFLAEALQRQSSTALKQGRSSIWERMESSSSSEGQFESPDSNKENRDPAVRGGRGDEEEGEDEDEERTLRIIAGKRAARDLAKKTEKLSKEGMRYVLEADARVALQQGKRSFLPSRRPAPLQGGQARGWSRAASDAQVLNRSRTILSRVPSLDMTAGRDRSKDGERPLFRSHLEARTAKRPHQSNVSQRDENIVPTRNASAQQNKRFRHDGSKTAQATALPLGGKGASQGLLRRFQPSHSMPTSNAASLSSRLGSLFPPAPLSSRFESARESNARLDGANAQHLQSLPSSQASSENGSDEWVEAWTQDRKRGSKRPSTVLTDRSSILNTDIRVASRLVPTARHDDSGFYGSDSGGEEGEQDAGLEKSHRHLISQDASSPIKRGDERDRLAAETLLGLGSHA